MTSRRTNAILLALLSACAASAQTPERARTNAQTQAQRQSPTQQKSKPADAAAAREAKARERREKQAAVAALSEAASAARGVEDTYKRALIIALAADALWPHDEAGARALFARAWEAAVASDEEEEGELEKRLREQSSAQETPDAFEEMSEVLTRVTRAREEVLAAASRHDSRLTERYIAELRESAAKRRGDAGTSEEESGRYDVRETLAQFDPGQLRLNLSRSLADEGDFNRAAEIAAPEIAGGVSAQLIRFLIELRESAPAEADGLYRRLLARASSDPRAGANDVLLLSSYALTPALLAAVDAHGSVRFSPVGGVGGAQTSTAPPLAAGLMRNFFEVAAGILTRPRRAAGSRADADALYFAITRLLPFVERGAPQLAPQLHARRQALAAELDAQSRDSLSRSARTESLTPSNPVDPLADDIEYAKRGPSSTARDAARSRVVRQAVKLKLWERARSAASEMEDAEGRAGYLMLIAVCQVASVYEAFDEDEDGDERAAQFVQNADVPPLTRALGYARAALLASKRNRPARARELLDKAQTFAEQTDSGTEARFQAFLVVATAAEETDPSRAWDAASSVAQAANEVRDAPADDLSGGFRAPHIVGVENVGLSEELMSYRLDALFASLAERDFTRALAQARSLSDPTTRSLVIVSAARVRLAGGDASAAKRVGAR